MQTWEALKSTPMWMWKGCAVSTNRPTPSPSHEKTRRQIVGGKIGDPKGIRTPVARMKTWCPRPN
jgi:hypothetical protein